jgi:hypothetical protein
LLIEPLVEDPASLHIDLEATCGGERIWVRVAFDNKDKGRVFGRGGRTLTAIRQVLSASALLRGQRLNVEVYNPNSRVDPLTR